MSKNQERLRSELLLEDKVTKLLGFFMSKKLERLRSELLLEDKITNLLGFLTK